jgi:acetolactate synthase I/II/III large subunit
VLFCDNALDMVVFQEMLRFGRTLGAQLGEFNTVDYAHAFGATGYRVTTEDNFLAALEMSLGEEGVSIIDVPVDYSHSTDIGAELHTQVLQ